MLKIPSGTVTFLFTDIEGSTKLWEQFPQAMQTAFPRHEAILRQVAVEHNGYVYKMIGDSLQIAFETAPDALTTALHGQRLLQSEPWGEAQIRVRMALHSGVTEERTTDYVGPVLNRLARIMASGHGGQVLLSQTVYELVRDNLSLDTNLLDLGEHRLKDLVRPEHIYQLTAPGLINEFPPLKTLDVLPNNLPVQLTSFIGREKEIEEIVHFFSTHPSSNAETSSTHHGTRLVTLTGAGGTGKTRLALQVAADLLEEFPDGAWLVELDSQTDPALVAHTTAAALDVHEASGKDILTCLVDFLCKKNLLLILDNCEHLITACASLIDRLLRSCPNLHILATSRELLGIQGEVAYLVPSLSTPTSRQPPPLETLAQSEAVRLFIERAQTASPGFTLTETNAAPILEICQRLDGIPLAIELAAARLRVLSVGQIAVRLNDVFRLLTGGIRTSLPRHQTLRALIDWSYNLLSEDEHILLQRLSVFYGGWTLEAAEAICPSFDVLTLLGGLVDKSLVLSRQKLDESADVEIEPRYRMLETIRQYADDKLLESGDSENVRNLHLAYYLKLAEAIEPELRGRKQIQRLDQLEEELDNLRTALEWSLTYSAVDELRLASALLWLWHIRYRRTEGIVWLERGLEAESTARGDQPLQTSQIAIRAKATGAVGCLHAMQRNIDPALTWLEQSRTLHRILGPQGRSGVAFVYHWLGLIAYFQSKYTRAIELGNLGLVIYRAINDKFGIGECLKLIGQSIAESGGDLHQATALLEEDLALQMEIGDQDGIATAYYVLAMLASHNHDLDRSIEIYEKSRLHYQQVGNLQLINEIDTHLGNLSLQKWDFPQAKARFTAVFKNSQEIGDQYFLVSSLLNLGNVNFYQGNYAEAFQHYAESLNHAPEENAQNLIGYVRVHQGMIHFSQGNLAEAQRCFEETWELSQESDIGMSAVLTSLNLGRVAQEKGDSDQAANHFQQAINQCLEKEQAQQNQYMLRIHYLDGLNFLGSLELDRGNLTNANSLLLEALNVFIQQRYQLGISFPLVDLARLAITQQQPERAATLLAAADHLFNPMIHLYSPAQRERYARDIAHLHSLLDEETFTSLWEQGRSMSPAAACDYAL